MATHVFSSLEELQIVTSDAYIIGKVSDIRYNGKWDAIGITTKTEKSVAKLIPSIGSGRSLIRIEPKNFIINDVILMQEKISELGSMITVDVDNAEKVSDLEGKKAVSEEGIILGTVSDINIDTDMWTVPTISIKLDKIAFEPLGLKKGLFSKTVISVRTEYIGSVGEIVTLNQKIQDMRDEVVLE